MSDSYNQYLLELKKKRRQKRIWTAMKILAVIALIGLSLFNDLQHIYQEMGISGLLKFLLSMFFILLSIFGLGIPFLFFKEKKTSLGLISLAGIIVCFSLGYSLLMPSNNHPQTTSPSPIKTSQNTYWSKSTPTEKKGTKPIPSSLYVYVTPHGEKYHRASCQYVQGKDCTEYSITAAEADGYEPCSVCNP